ncbi:hypothetical protein ACIFOT_28915 [Neobacillus sp. NRS-1170]|uniref:hypothetical protein n=1 Tax=Neobacillus sp. NRS-1170 TaxID=3233898 RepID=UPI003D2D960C
MLDLDKTEGSDAKSILMMTAAYVETVKEGNGNFTSDKCVDALIGLFNGIPEPDVLKRLKKMENKNKQKFLFC